MQLGLSGMPIWNFVAGSRLSTVNSPTSWEENESQVHDKIALKWGDFFP